MIKITVTKFTAHNWIANWVGTPTCNASGTTVLSAAENLLLKYNMIGVDACIIMVDDGEKIVNYDNPVPVTISKDRLS